MYLTCYFFLCTVHECVSETELAAPPGMWGENDWVEAIDLLSDESDGTRKVGRESEEAIAC